MNIYSNGIYILSRYHLCFAPFLFLRKTASIFNQISPGSCCGAHSSLRDDQEMKENRTDAKLYKYVSPSDSSTWERRNKCLNVISLGVKLTVLTIIKMFLCLLFLSGLF